MLEKSLLIVSVTCLVVIVSACSTMEPKQAYSQYQPSTLPVRNVTHFNAALECFDALLLNAPIQKPIYITSEGIPNHAGSEITLLSGRDMLISTISRLQRSNAFVFIDLPSLPTTQLLEQLGIAKSHPAHFEEYLKIYARWNQSLPNPAPKRANYPDYSIIGAITQSEKGTLVDSKGASVVLEEGDFGVSKDDMVSVISMDMNIVDTQNFEVLNGMGSANSIAVYKQGAAGDLGGRIKKAGVYFNFSFDRSEGTGQAIRTLMQLSAIEVLGKLAKVPYQRCLPSDSESPQNFAERVTPMPAAPPVQTRADVDVKLTPSKPDYRVNDVLTFQTQVSDDAHVHCFYQNYQGGIWRVFPNQVQASDFLIAHAPVSIPAQNKAFEIALDMANVTEQVMCLAAREGLDSDFSGLAVSEQSRLPAGTFAEVVENYRKKSRGSVYRQVLPIHVQ